MTLTRLGAFVLVAGPGSVRAAADVLKVSEPAVSRASAARRAHPGAHLGDELSDEWGDELPVRDGNGMALGRGRQPTVRHRLADGRAGLRRRGGGAGGQGRAPVPAGVPDRLGRPAYRQPRYRPLVGSVAAAWPRCDAVVSAHRLTALSDLIDAPTDPHRRRSTVLEKG